MRWTVVPTPIGGLGLAVRAGGVCRVSFSGVPEGAVADPADGPGPDAALLAAAAAQLRAYFAGERPDFDVPLAPPGGSEFERAVWHRLAGIPYGEMVTYGDVARAVGDAGAARAVGVACNRNPLPVVVPCHRVVGAGRTLVGFGGGLERKRFLLELEARVRVERDFAGA
jgi:methylated-DNA-[protein]-cysteine S-methyltransferase